MNGYNSCIFLDISIIVSLYLLSISLSNNENKKLSNNSFICTVFSIIITF